MKYPAHIYAKALVEVLSDQKTSGTAHDAEVAKNFLALIKKNGDESHLKKILEEASRFARGKSGVRKVTIASARELSPSQTETMGRFVKPGDVVERRIDPELIAGIKITLNDEMQFDGSLKTKLNKVLGSV
jgi:F0F1-type ATP synthase delta subunit